MKDKLVRKGIEIRKSSIQGYGVFATHAIKQGEIIEECYMLIMPEETIGLKNYTFVYSDNAEDKRRALALGYGSLYNHADSPNAMVKLDRDNQLVVFIAKQNIAKNAEVLVDYGQDWFISRGVKVLQIVPPKNKWLNALIRLTVIVLLMLMFHLILTHSFSM